MKVTRQLTSRDAHPTNTYSRVSQVSKIKVNGHGTKPNLVILSQSLRQSILSELSFRRCSKTLPTSVKLFRTDQIEVNFNFLYII